jgi:hypothetical protein
MNTVWANRWGRLAIFLILVGVIGLTLHFWAVSLLFGGLTLPRGTDCLP